MHHTNKAAPAASPTYKSEDTPPLASATRESQHHHYSTTTHHHFVTINNGPQNLTPARLEMLPAGNQPEFLRNSAWRRLCLSSCGRPPPVAGPAEANALTIGPISAAEARLVWPERRSGGEAASPERSARRAAPCRPPRPTSLARAAEPARAERRAQGWLWRRKSAGDMLRLLTLEIELHDDCRHRSEQRAGDPGPCLMT
jgi:hypothetical protein